MVPAPEARGTRLPPMGPVCANPAASRALRHSRRLTPADRTGRSNWPIELARQYALVRVDVRITRRAVIGSRKPVVVTARSAGGAALADAVVGTVKVVR